MARPLSSTDWPARVTNSQISAVTGQAALTRGSAYADSNRVRKLAVSGNGAILTAEVRGSYRSWYQTMVFADLTASRLSWKGSCSCPVGSNCKHVAALVLAARRQCNGYEATGRHSDWEERLTLLLTERTTAGRAVALEIAQVAGRSRWRTRRDALSMLPLIAGKRGWVRQGISWAAVLDGRLAREVSPDALDALVELVEMNTADDLYYADARLFLDQLPSRVWRTLHRCVEAGITLTTAQRGGHPVRILSGASAGASLRRREDGSLAIAPAVDLTGVEGIDERTREAELSPVGDPPHAYAVTSADGSLTLLPLDPPPGEVLARLLERHTQPIVVPAEDVPRFEERHLEALGSAVPIIGGSADLRLPEPSHPCLVLRVGIDPDAHRATTSWWIRYVTASGQGRGEVEAPDLSQLAQSALAGAWPAADVALGRAPEGSALRDAAGVAAGTVSAGAARARAAVTGDGGPGATSAGAPGAGVGAPDSGAVGPGVSGAALPGRAGPPARRDRAAEETLARRVVNASLPLAQTFGPLWVPRDLRGMATVRFFAEVLPALEAVEGVVIEVEGRVPDYHEAPEAPLVTTDVEDDQEGQDWFSLRVRVRVGDEEIPMESLMTAVADGDDAVLLDSGAWVSLAGRPEIVRLARLMEEGRDLRDPEARSVGALSISSFHAGYYAELVSLGVVGRAAQRWKEGVDRLLAVVTAAERATGPSGVFGSADGTGRAGDAADAVAGDAGSGGAGVDPAGASRAAGLQAGADRAGAGHAGADRAGVETAVVHRSADTDPADPIDVPVPVGLKATLRPYQLDGYRWLNLLRSTGLGGVLADDMGLGKTIQVLAAVQRMVEERREGREDGQGPVLVIAPTSVVGAWVEQAARFCPELRVRPVTRTATKRGTALAEEVTAADVVVTSYTIARLEEDDFTAVDWAWVVLDEAQFIKNHASATYKAVRRLQTDSTLAITGTPLENSLMDLWSLLSVSAPGLLPGPDRFSQLYRRPVEHGDSEALASLRARMRPFMLRRTKEEVALDLPVKTEQVLSVELGAAHRRAYDKRLARERQKVLGLLEEDTAQARFNALRSLTILRQAALDPALVEGASSEAEKSAGEQTTGEPGAGKKGSAGGRGRGSRRPRKPSAKVEVLLDNLRPVVAEGHKALVFSQFTRYLAGVRQALEDAGLRTAYLDGTTANRQEVIDSFRTGTADVFLISLKAGGFGLTLTEADYVFLLDPWWNPQVEEQAVDRTHRIGQDKPVLVYRLVAADTIEEKVMALKEKKAELFDRVVEGAGQAQDAGELAAGTSRARLTAAEIRELVGA